MNIKWGSRWKDKHELSSLVGETIKSVSGLEVRDDLDNDEVIFVTESGKALKLYHDQDCCEHVRMIDIELDADDFSGAVVLSAEEVVGETMDDDYGTRTYTFYKIETTKGGIWMRWLGESNGYYSESVHILTGAMESEQ